jgi:GDPmannose 4,6-dehydratase
VKALIFGVNGQDGYYLNSLLREQSIEVLGVSRTNKSWIMGDVSNKEFVEKIISQSQPDYVFHLAANSSTNHKCLFENHETIATGTLNVLEAVYKFSKSSRVFISGSGLQFKNSGHPVSENDEFEARDVYSASRIASVYASRYFRTLGIKVYVGYLFNHESPLRAERHISKTIINYCKNIDKQSEKLRIGDLNVKKEWTFAGDVVEAVWALINQENVYECIIGSGKPYSIEEWIAVCFGMIKKDWNEYVELKQKFAAEYNILVSDPKLIKSMGWEQRVKFESLAEMMLYLS